MKLLLNLHLQHITRSLSYICRRKIEKFDQTMRHFFLNKTIIINPCNWLIQFTILLSISCYVACQSDNQAIIDEKVEEHLSAFREKKNAECRFDLLAEAEKIVDSLLLAEAKMEMSDSLTRRPFKPEKPAPVPPIDSLPILPIFPPDSPANDK